MKRSRLHILNIVGARPNFMKIAPLMKEYATHTDSIKASLLHTGQHYDEELSGAFFSELEIPKPDTFLGVGSGTHAEQTARIMVKFEKAVSKERPDLVLVVGDVNSTLACTLVAAKLQIPVAHVEAGLRSFDRSMPEEINRIVTDALADLLFTTSRDANENLLREGIPQEKIFFVGNTMIDTLMRMRPLLKKSRARGQLSLNGHRFAYVTLHRPSNVDDKNVLRGICDAFEKVQQQVTLVWPLHPRTRKMLEQHGLASRLASMKNVRIADPLPYIDSLALMAEAQFVITDSGGIQEETTVLGIPCLTLRPNTERPVTVTEGTNDVIGNDPAVIEDRALRLAAGHGAKQGRIPTLWDGKAAERIVGIMLQRWNEAPLAGISLNGR